MDETDKTIKNLLIKVRRGDSDVSSTYCPDEKILSLYIDGMLGVSERERIEQHLLDCAYCLDLVLLHRKAGREEAYSEFPDAPLLWKEKAKNLHGKLIREGKTAILDIILKFANDALEVISNPGGLAVAYGSASGPVRSGNRILSPNLITLSKTFSDMESEVEVERIDDRHVNMKIRTVDARSRAPVKVLRISLLNPVRELASYITDDGEVSFGNLTYGEYAIKIIRDREEIGQISLNITLNAN